jgi:hypothetical protein
MLSYFKWGCFGNNWVMSCRKNVHCGDLSVQPVKLHARHYDSLNSSMLADAASIISIISSTCHECLSPVFFLTAANTTKHPPFHVQPPDAWYLSKPPGRAYSLCLTSLRNVLTCYYHIY